MIRNVILLAFFAIIAASASEEKKFNFEGRILLNRTYTTMKWRENTLGATLQGDNEVSYQSIVRKDGGFSFYEIPSGSYLLTIQSNDFLFAPMRVDISSKTGNIKVSRLLNELAQLNYPLIIEPEGRHDYFMLREGFNVMSLLKNPMILMMGFTLVMTLAVPKLMASIDPEALAEMQGKDKDNKEPVELPLKWSAPPLQIRN